MRWMKLEPIIQNEVSQEEKHQYSILTYILYIYVNIYIFHIYIYGIERDGNYDRISNTAKET